MESGWGEDRVEPALPLPDPLLLKLWAQTAGTLWWSELGDIGWSVAHWASKR